ncbi:condensin complex subunit 3-like [Hylaeus anthracinus]|uniref:condensin complex subunit 3-like n=1 Tax=Hylaeus anthracinus TaxID=313031 RepID=UPI0023B92FE7|nr:condensin complex subunit 3-like [Hylaeus anthracinus]
MRRKLIVAMKEIFYNVQFNRNSHKNNLKRLRKYYEQSELSNFWEIFVSCFKLPLTNGQHHRHIEYTLEFVAKFAASLYTITDDESQESVCPFLVKLFDFLLNNHSVKEMAVRYRICQFLNILLFSMGDQAFIDDALCDKITISMMDRLIDKSPKVRAQAIAALHRLQDPMDDQCPIIKMYMFHASKDPKSEVRKAALMYMGKNQRTLQVALRRTRDVNEGVRKMAYEFISKITVRSLSITQRDRLLNDGLKDRSEIVKKCVENVLLPSWLRHYDGDFINLVRALDAEIGTDVSVLALETLFKRSALNTLIEQLPINKETKLIPLDKLTTENVLYWRCLLKYLYQNEYTEELEQVVPELSTFCTYISDFLRSMSTNQSEIWVNHMQKFILLQLFEITTTYDLSDELGRKKLKELICNNLLSNYWSVKIIGCTVTHLQKVIPDVNSRIDTLAHIISDIRLPLKEPSQVTQISEYQLDELNVQKARLKVKLLVLKDEEYEAIQAGQFLKADSLQKEINALNQEIIKLSVPPPPPATPVEEIKEKDDPETMIKCLSIICTMMQPINSLTPTLRGLMQIGFDSLEHPDDNVRVLAIKVIGINCILDKELAKKHLLTLFLQFSLEQQNQEIWIVTLKGIFDLLLVYGLEYFDILVNRNEPMNRTEKSHSVRLYSDADREVSLSSTQRIDEIGGNNCNFIQVLVGLLDNANEEVRTVAGEGIAKLLLHRRINSSTLLSRLIILCYNPVNDGDFYLRQCLSAFFNNFLIRVPEGQKMFEEAYLPTMKLLYTAPNTSPLQEIDPYHISRFILNMTRQDIFKPTPETYCAHNNIVFIILGEVLNPNNFIDQEMLLRSLLHLHLNIDSDTFKERLQITIQKVSETINSSNRRLMKYIELFIRKLETPNVHIPEDEDTEEADD